MADLRIERVVITGGRKFNDAERIERDLAALLRPAYITGSTSPGLTRVAHGCATGADAIAGKWALRWLRPVGCVGYQADWTRDGKSAGPRRNIRMLDTERPDLVLAYPDPESRGTWHCVREALKRGLTVAVWVRDLSPGPLGKFVRLRRGDRVVAGPPASFTVSGLAAQVMEVLGG